MFITATVLTTIIIFQGLIIRLVVKKLRKAKEWYHENWHRTVMK